MESQPPKQSSQTRTAQVLPQGPMITKAVDCDGVAAEGGEGYKDNSRA